MDFLTVLHDYGWAGVILLMTADKVFPFIAGKVFPQIQRKQLAGIEADKVEREFRHAMELRQADAFDRLVQTTQSIEKFIVSVDGRLEGIERSAQIKPSRRKAPRS